MFKPLILQWKSIGSSMARPLNAPIKGFIGAAGRAAGFLQAPVAEGRVGWLRHGIAPAEGGVSGAVLFAVCDGGGGL